MTYFLLFFFKFVENSISTLRIILISHNHKWLGAILNFLIAIIWSMSTVLIVTNRDIVSIIYFAFGCFLGSLMGSFLEEKINKLFLK